MSDNTPSSETYSLSNLPALEQSMATRTVQASAGFFIKHLQPGMRVLDCGCGPGTITLGLAEAVGSGEVVGIDIDVDGLEAARSRATAHGITNVHFESSSVYDLPFPDGSFDAVFAHALLIHLSDPLTALREMKRVLRPEGVIGIRDADRGFDLRLPETPRLKEMFDLWVRVLIHNGASPFYARHQRELLIEVGLQNVTANAFALTYGTVEETHRNAQGTRNVFLGLARTALGQGWTDETEVAAICEEILAWGDRPDAFGLTLWFSTVGWAPAFGGSASTRGG